MKPGGRKKVLIICLLSIAVFNAWFYFSYSPDFNYKEYLSDLSERNVSVFDHIRENIDEIINKGGVEGVTLLTTQAFKQNLITMYECHTLAHIIGHNSDLELASSEELLAKIGVNFCEGGFKHGVAAEITLRGLYEGKDYKEDLYEYCRFLIENDVGNDCYHGAGHEFMGQTVDVHKALSLCDTLSDGPIADPSECYKGVFSEYTNMLGGVDGETGFRLASGPLISLSAHPVEFCASFDEKYRLPCALEVSGFNKHYHGSKEELVGSFNECMQGEYDKELKEGCIRSVAAVSTQNDLPYLNTIVPPEEVLVWTEDYRRAYIDGVGSEMHHFLINGSDKDWKTFCESFSTRDYDFCAKYFYGY